MAGSQISSEKRSSIFEINTLKRIIVKMSEDFLSNIRMQEKKK